MEKNVTISLSVDDAFKLYAIVIRRLEDCLQVVESFEKADRPVPEWAKEATEKYNRIACEIRKAISDSKQ